jgi:CRP-like cAMP-binding protein
LADFDSEAIRQALETIPVFADALRPDELAHLALQCTRTTFRPGEVLMHQGDAAFSMFCIVEGTVSISLAGRLYGQREINRLHAGSVVGEMALLTGGRRLATATALTEVHALEIPKPVLDDLLAADPDLAEDLRGVSTARSAILEDAALAHRASLKTRFAEAFRRLVARR